MNLKDYPEVLITEQVRLEEEMTRKGAERYLRDTAKAKSAGREEGTSYGQAILSGRLDLLAQAIQYWMVDASSGKSGKVATAFLKVKGMDPHTLAFLTLKNVLAGVTSVRTLQFVAVSIGTGIEDEMRFAKIREDERKAYDKIVEGAKKRGAYHYRHHYAVRRAQHMGDGWDKWSRTDRLHVGIKMLDIMMGSIGLVEIAHQKVEKDQSVKYVRPLNETLEWIEKKNEVAQFLRPVYEPMVVRPRDWTTPFDGGYLSSNIKPLRLVKTKNSSYLHGLKQVDMPIVYQSINALQRTPWQINTDVLEVMQELWENGSTLGGLPSRGGAEMPPKPPNMDNADARKEWRIAAAKVHVQNLSVAGKRIAFNISLGIAKRYASYEQIFFPYQLDFRGRVYAVPHLNPQGSDYQKAMLRFAKGKPMGTEGWKWLAIHGANVAGNDKVSLEDRVNWILDHEDEILAIAADPFNNRGWSTNLGDVEIDSPWQFLAFCFEWKGYCEQGDDFVSRIPIAMDGSCSGLQHFSAMLKDEVGGAVVNLAPSEKPQDVYQMVANKVLEKVNQDALTGTDDELKHNEDGTPWVKEGTKSIAKQWQEFGISRKTTKRSVMTLAYGSKEYGFREQLMEDIITPARQAVNASPNRRFPFTRDGYAAAQYMAKLIWLSVNEVLVKASEAMKWLQGVAQLAASEELPLRWTTPIGFPVMQAYQDVEARRVKTAINGKLVFLTMYRDKERLDRRRQSQGVAPNFVHACDASHLMLTVLRAHQEGITNFAMIHDSFGTTAGDAEDMFRIVRESFVEIYDTVDVLGAFKEEIEGQLKEQNREKLCALPEAGTLDIKQVVDSRYCFA